MEANLFHTPADPRSPASERRTLLDRVRDLLDALSRADAAVWARTSGPQVLVGVRRDEPFARISPLGGGQYGLGFRALEASTSHANAWEPLLLVDDLDAVVEHALVAVDALDEDAS